MTTVVSEGGKSEQWWWDVAAVAWTEKNKIFIKRLIQLPNKMMTQNGTFHLLYL